MPIIDEDDIPKMGMFDWLKTTPTQNKKFPNVNQASHCWNRYNEWVLCLKETDSDEAACKKLRGLAVSICPNDWREAWDEERAEGNFSGLKV
eukprot:CAMPEP_0194278978 /NCGR_PEP_ID=MMETSP0169-20130528/12890_1 /TAXON_ID=218684 /ORGANISM="Corethron pennatum, Strain L29A3" /LENGTH=91 /DNA_ID=CAMNT_0039023309 /DNA_START=67 /DNA_END=342 /DNA_ORIENTATION=+